MEVRTPWDLENEVGLTEGNIFQGELTFDQLLFNRPYPACRSTARRCPASTCAAPQPIRAAASWARQAPTRRARCCSIWRKRVARHDRATTPSSSAPATTASSPPHCWPRPAGARWCWRRTERRRHGRRNEALAPAFDVPAGRASRSIAFAPAVERGLELGAPRVRPSPQRDLATTGHRRRRPAARRSRRQRRPRRQLPQRLLRASPAAGALAARCRRRRRGSRTPAANSVTLGRAGARPASPGHATTCASSCASSCMNARRSARRRAERRPLEGGAGLRRLVGSTSPRARRAPCCRCSTACTAGAAGAAPLALPKGGVAGLIAALERAAKASGAEIRTAAPVARILVDVDRAKGVVLGDRRGDRGAAGALQRRSEAHLPGVPRTARDRHRHRSAGRAAARARHGRRSSISSPTVCPTPWAEGRVLLVDSLDALEESFDGAKYGEAPKVLAAELVAPGLLSGDGGQQAPLGDPDLRADPLPRGRRARADRARPALALLEQRFPGPDRRALPPSACCCRRTSRRASALTGGDWHQGETTIEQLFFLRPFAEAAQYATPHRWALPLPAPARIRAAT